MLRVMWWLCHSDKNNIENYYIDNMCKSFIINERTHRIKQKQKTKTSR